jgi:hypothetical protein
MIIRKLIKDDQDALKPVFESKKYMGVNADKADFFEKDRMAELYWAAFCTTYLTDLKSYHAFGAFDEQGNVLGIISCYQSPDEPSWYGTQIRNNGSKIVARELLDTMIKFNESVGRLKFYTLWNAKHGKLLRRFIFSDWANERYDYFDEYRVSARNKCIYTSHWHILFNRILLPNDVLIRCTFLKQKYRDTLCNGGNI